MTKKTEVKTETNVPTEEIKKLPGLKGFDMSRYMAKPCEMSLNLKRELVTIHAKRPGDQIFFRINPDPKYEMPVWMLHLKEEDEKFLIDQDLVPILAEQSKLYILYEGMMLNGNVFLYPIQQKSAEDKVWNSWHRSAYAVVQLAKEHWVRAVAEKSISGYTPIVAMSNLAEPIWPEKSMVELISIAFKDNLIDTEDHPVIKQLKGL